MLLNGGELDGVRLLRAETVERMTRNQIGDFKVPFSGHGDGFGLGVGVLTERGIFHTYFWVDPERKLIGILMTQVFPFDHLKLRDEFRHLTYDALAK